MKLDNDYKVGQRLQSWTTTTKLDNDYKVGQRLQSWTTTTKLDNDYEVAYSSMYLLINSIVSSSNAFFGR